MWVSAGGRADGRRREIFLADRHRFSLHFLLEWTTIQAETELYRGLIKVRLFPLYIPTLIYVFEPLMIASHWGYIRSIRDKFAEFSFSFPRFFFFSSLIRRLGNYDWLTDICPSRWTNPSHSRRRRRRRWERRHRPVFNRFNAFESTVINIIVVHDAWWLFSADQMFICNQWSN